MRLPTAHKLAATDSRFVLEESRRFREFYQSSRAVNSRLIKSVAHSSPAFGACLLAGSQPSYTRAILSDWLDVFVTKLIEPSNGKRVKKASNFRDQTEAANTSASVLCQQNFSSSCFEENQPLEAVEMEIAFATRNVFAI
jgi:hypothetical protein